MYKHNKNITFIILIFLILIEITSIFLNIIILINSIELNASSENLQSIKGYLMIKTILNIIANTTSIVMVLIYGIYSLYFEIKTNLLIYLIL